MTNHANNLQNIKTKSKILSGWGFQQKRNFLRTLKVYRALKEAVQKREGEHMSEDYLMGGVYQVLMEKIHYHTNDGAIYKIDERDPFHFEVGVYIPLDNTYKKCIHIKDMNYDKFEVIEFDQPIPNAFQGERE
jgi:hypothetical protein